MHLRALDIWAWPSAGPDAASFGYYLYARKNATKCSINYTFAIWTVMIPYKNCLDETLR
jgi:hypothetical protein